MGYGEAILGISEEHDAGVALIEEGRIVLASNEERYSRVKFHRGLPGRSLDWLLTQRRKQGKSIPKEIAVASRFHVGSNLGDWYHLDTKYEIVERLFSLTGLDRLLGGTSVGPAILRCAALFERPEREHRIRTWVSGYGIENPRITFVDHHTAHATAAYYTSGWKSSLVITQDASGDGWCSKVFVGEGGRLREVHAVPFFHSPGHYYEYVTFMLGFKLGREGKVTGLAASGNPDKTYPIFLSEMHYDSDHKRYVNHALYRKREIDRLKLRLFGISREDIASGVQKHLSEMMMKYIVDMIKDYAARTPVNLAVAGGVFANVKLNGSLASLPQVRELYVYPHMGDGGLAAGAAFSLAAISGLRPKRISDVYLGDSPSERDIRAVIGVYKKRIRVAKPKDLSGRIARALHHGHVVAIVRGRMEYGPRALGHRSLLVRATDPRVNDWLNRRLRRSEFMPFAPILRQGDLGRYFKGSEKVMSSLPFMTVTLSCNARCKREAPAIVHVDGSARPQVVTRGVEPFIYDVLTQYARLSGLRILINTSYNIHEEPIVRTPEEAIETFLTGSIDVLILGDYYITRRS